MHRGFRLLGTGAYLWLSVLIGTYIDGWSLFVFGLDLSKRVKSMPGLGLGAKLDYENAHVRNNLSNPVSDDFDANHTSILKRLPGLVCDIEPEAEKGRIGLVSKQGGDIARTARFYI